MAINWGPFTNHLRIGIEVWNDPYDTWTPHINVWAAFWVQVDSTWNFSDQQNLVLGNSASANWPFFNNFQKNQAAHIGTYRVPDQGQSYGGGPDYFFYARLDGVYLGAGPEHGVGYRLPPRPIRAPSAPGPPLPSQVTATSANFTWNLPADQGGWAPTHSWLEVARGGGQFANVIYSQQDPGWAGRTVNGLPPNTTMVARVAANNPAGWSPFSSVSTFSTLSFQAGTPTLSSVGSSQFTASWTAPGGGTANGWEMQVARDTGFATIAQSPSGTSWATSATVSGLSAATTYYVRVRARTASGYGAWSAAGSATTASPPPSGGGDPPPPTPVAGPRVRVGTSWNSSTARVWRNGQWVVATVHKRVNNAWVR